MPELPEVETVVRGLKFAASSRRIAKITHISPHLIEREPKLGSIAGETFADFSRRGKYIIARFASGRRLLIHLRMSGRLLVKNKREQPGKHDHLVLILSKGNEKLVFSDVRKFGMVQLLGDNGNPSLDSLGPEATTIRSREMFRLLQSSRRPIKALLLDQTKIAGLGNIYVDESLHRAGIHPCNSADRISWPQTVRLTRAVHQVLKSAIKYNGTTFDSYRGTNGAPGRFAALLKVYSREGEKCSSCGGAIAKIKACGRGTHFCPTCQPLTRRKTR